MGAPASGTLEAFGLPPWCPYGDRAFAYYDGRSTAAENWEERTGLAWSTHGLAEFAAVAGGPVAVSPHAPGGLRYLSVIDLGAGRYRLFYEATRENGSHELRTELVDVGTVHKGAAA